MNAVQLVVWADMGQPRGILPTFVDEARVVLSKTATRIRNSNEIRLCLYLAVKSSRAFVLAVPPGTRVDPEVCEHVVKHGGRIVETVMRDFSVYFGALDSAGGELDGWVLGNSDSWERFRDSVRSSKLLGRVTLGHSVVSETLPILRQELTELARVRTDIANIDNEDVFDALRNLVSLAEGSGGSLFVQ